MVTPVIDKRHARGVHVRLAFGIVCPVLRHRTRCDDDQAVPRVRVPAGASSRLPHIALDVQV